MMWKDLGAMRAGQKNLENKKWEMDVYLATENSESSFSTSDCMYSNISRMMLREISVKIHGSDIVTQDSDPQKKRWLRVLFLSVAVNASCWIESSSFVSISTIDPFSLDPPVGWLVISSTRDMNIYLISLLGRDDLLNERRQSVVEIILTNEAEVHVQNFCWEWSFSEECTFWFCKTEIDSTKLLW